MTMLWKFPSSKNNFPWKCIKLSCFPSITETERNYLIFKSNFPDCSVQFAYQHFMLGIACQGTMKIDGLESLGKSLTIKPESQL